MEKVLEESRLSPAEKQREEGYADRYDRLSRIFSSRLSVTLSFRASLLTSLPHLHPSLIDS